MAVPAVSEPNSPPRRPADEYRRLLAEKKALEQVVRVTEGIERLHSGLQAAVLMGKATNLISRKALRFFQDLSENIRLQPSAKLRATLARLEERMRTDLQRIVAVATVADDGPTPMDEQVTALVTDFRRVSQTAVALRVVLRERGEATRPCPLPVTHELLRECVERVAERERGCRSRVERDLVRMEEEARALLTVSALPLRVRGMVAGTVNQLRANLQHLRAGKSIESLPHPVEVIEVSDEAGVVAELEALPAERVEPGSRRQPPAGEDASLFEDLSSWLNTPWDVGWEQVRQGRSRAARGAKK